MRVQMTIGARTVVVEDFSHSPAEEACRTWPDLLDDIIWPTLRSFGYFIDSEFTDSIPEHYDEYLEDMRNAKHTVGRVGTPDTRSEIPYKDWERSDRVAPVHNDPDQKDATPG